MAGTDCVIDIPISMKLDLIWVPVVTSTPIIASKREHGQKEISEGAAVINESNHHESQVLEVPVMLEDSGVSMSSGRSESSGGTPTHSVSSPSHNSVADSAYGSPCHHAYRHNAFFNGLDDGFWPRPIREDAAPASPNPNMSDVELLKNTGVFALLVLMIFYFMIFTLCTARNYSLMAASISMGLILLIFTCHHFYNTLVELYTRTRQRANIPLVIYNRPRLPQIIAN